MPKYPFEAPFDEIMREAETYVDAVFSCLESEFLVMPKGSGFVEYRAFERGYEALKAATKGFSELNATRVLPAALAEPISIVVLRTMLGFTPPESDTRTHLTAWVVCVSNKACEHVDWNSPPTRFA